MPLSLAMQAALKAITAVKPSVPGSIKAQRAMEDTLGLLEPENHRCRVDKRHEVMADGSVVPLLVFTPTGRDAKNRLLPRRASTPATEDRKGTIVFVHGGGWVTGNPELYTDACISLALTLDRRIVSIDYPLAPETRFPTALEDCYEIVRRVLAKKVLPDVNPFNVTLFGDSAGGNLVAALSTLARDRGEFSVPAQVLLYPVLQNDYGPDSPFPSVHENGKGYVLTAQDMVDYLKLYARGPEDLNNPYLAPMLAESKEHLPRTLVISAEYCPLRDEDEDYAALLLNAGNKVACYRVLDAIHGYLLYPSMSTLVKATHKIMKGFLDGEAPEQNEDKPEWLTILPGTSSRT